MKKLRAILVAVVIALVVILGLVINKYVKKDSSINQGSNSAANGNTTEESQEESEDTALPLSSVIEDHSLMAMNFTPPEEFLEAERYVDSDSKGEVREKKLIYTLPTGDTLSFAYIKDTLLSEVVEMSELDRISSEGQSFYLYDEDSSHMAFTEFGDDLYGVSYNSSNDDAYLDLLKSHISTITFTETEKTAINENELGHIYYEFGRIIPMSSYALSSTENSEGKLVRTSLALRFGDNPDETRFRFLIRVYKDALLEEVLDPELEYEEKTIGEYVYTIEKPSQDEKPFAYYIQINNDVYLIKNNGRAVGQSVVRSEESTVHFREFLNSISFN